MMKNSIYNYPVVPEEGEHYQRCAHKPLTRKEMKCDFRNALFMKHPDSQACWQALLHYKLASAVFFYSRHWIREKDGFEWAGWQHNLRKLAEAGIYLFHIGMQWYGEEETRGYFDFLGETFGEKFIGLKGDSELDGGYTAGWCWTGPFAEMVGLSGEPSPDRSRKQAREEYDRVLDCFYERAFHRGLSISSLGYGCHYAAEHGARMLGIEAVEALPSDTLLWSFCRGAAKQYDLLTAVSISPSSRWGQKFHTRDGENQADVDFIAGPDYNPSVGLLKREWYVAYMNGASLIFFSAGLFPQVKYEMKLSGDYEPFIMAGGPNKPGWGLLEANLTPTGRRHVEGQEFAADHPVRGVPYMPVALLLDHDHGWNPPRHLYRPDEDHVWGNIPYARGDYQIDHFFRWVYPDYHLASYYRDERGYITNTPFGDLFEVVLSNASSAGLNKYRAVVLLGDHEVRSESDTARRLLGFLEEGGIVVAGLDQWPDIPEAVAGVKPSGRWMKAAGEVLSWDGRRFKEAEFEYQSVEVTDGRAASLSRLLQASDGAPLMVRHGAGQGMVYLVTVRGWGRTAKRHDFLKGIQHVLGGLFKDLNLVEIQGRPIFYLVNVTDRDDELILTLVNNSSDLPWEGIVGLRGETIAGVEPWLGHSEVGVEDGRMRCGVPANDVRIYKLKADRSFLPLTFRGIDWESLGVGRPDTDFQTCPARKGSHV
jgi:hypothetical protein